jgi:hypothetical protein
LVLVDAGVALLVEAEPEVDAVEEDPPASLLEELEESVEDEGVVEEDAPRLSFL